MCYHYEDKKRLLCSLFVCLFVCLFLYTTLIFEFSSCRLVLDFEYLPTNNKAVRFKFRTTRQFTGPGEQFLYLHCKMTTCRREEIPRMNVFNCYTQAQYCPHQGESEITVGPFTVWPVGAKQDRKKSRKSELTMGQIKPSKYD